ncbi:MAG: hypothetical protein RQ723_05245 [Desulfuromonadales bacterium]|nr:hypothetical protein [Desulfuromonadales bacterium]
MTSGTFRGRIFQNFALDQNFLSLEAKFSYPKHPSRSQVGALFRAINGFDSSPTVKAAPRRLGYNGQEFVSHGWRAIFRTLADEILQERIDIIEAQLAHQVSDALGRAYNRTSFLKERRDLMNRWGNYLYGIKSGAKVIPLKRSKG